MRATPTIIPIVCPMKRTNIKALLWFSCIGLTTTCALSAAADTLTRTNPLPQIFRDWAKRRQENNQINYEYAVVRLWPKGAFNNFRPAQGALASSGDNPSTNTTGMVRISAALDFDNNRCRIDTDEEDYQPNRNVLYRFRMLVVGSDHVCYKQILLRTEPVKTKVDFVITSGEMQPDLILSRPYNLPIILASGVVPVKKQRVKEVHFALALDSEAFFFEGFVDGIPSTAVLRVDDFENGYSATNRYWVDLSRASAIVRYESQIGSSNGNTSATEIAYKPVEDTWLPSGWQRTASVRGVTKVVESARVTAIGLQKAFSNELFILSPTTGMFVKEYHYGGRDTVSKEIQVTDTQYLITQSGMKTNQKSWHQNWQFSEFLAEKRHGKSANFIRIIIILVTLLPMAWIVSRILASKKSKKN